MWGLGGMRLMLDTGMKMVLGAFRWVKRDTGGLLMEQLARWHIVILLKVVKSS